MARIDRREQILRAALTVIAEKGYHATGVSDIAEHAGVARGTFYLYFESKRALFDALLEGIFLDLLSEIRPIRLPDGPNEPSVEAQVRSNATRLVHRLMSDRDTVRVLMAEAEGLDEDAQGRLRAFYGRLGSWLAESLADGVALGIVQQCNPLVAAHALIGSIRGVLWAWAMGLADVDEGVFVNELLCFLRGGLLTK